MRGQAALPSSPSLSDPLLGSDDGEEDDARARSHRRWLVLLLAGTFTLYILLGVFERLAFAQMVLLMPTGVLLMHTLLALMSLLLFVVLQLARSQSNADEQPVSDALQELRLSEVLQMAILDSLHSLLALGGATTIPGVAQTLLLQVQRQRLGHATSGPIAYPLFCLCRVSSHH